MNKKRFLAMLAKKEARKAELQTKGGTTEDVKELRSINTELESINTEIAELRSMLEAMTDDEAPAGEGLEQRSAGSPVGVTQVVATFTGAAGTPQAPEARGGVDNSVIAQYERRGEVLKSGKPVVVAFDETAEERAVNLAGGTLVNPKQYSNNLNPTQNEVSGLLDAVNAIPLNGGESYTQAFEVSGSEGGYTTETGDYTDGDPVVDYVEIGKAKITAYTEITDEASKLPNINYQALVAKNVRNAIRKKISKMIMTGAGGANAITGIFNAPTKVIPLASDLEISEIDADTLDKIVFGYGGNEDVEGIATLILSKTDLAAFAAIRDANGKKLYDISVNGNSGTISSDGSFSVPYILNSICPALSAVATSADTYCMAYGKLGAYEMPVFSPLTIEESRDYKFKSGQIAYRGVVWAGGNVAAYKGFIRIKKVAAT
jgi:HK97 family phage major capsid protein